jgi:ribosomal-protein-alanine N-acetyltransferase
MNLVPINLDWRPPVLHSARLIVRPYQEADAPLLFPLVSNPNSTRYTLWEHHKSLDDTLFFVRDYAQSRYAEGVPEPMAVAFKDDQEGKPIGSVGCYWFSQPNHAMELGYWLAEKYWGQGLMAEACQLLVSYCFATFEVQRIQARVIEGNAASVRVLEKIGFGYEGTLRSAILRRGRFEDVLIFSNLKERPLAASP